MSSVHPQIKEIADRLRAITFEVEQFPVLPDESEAPRLDDGLYAPVGLEEAVKRANRLYRERRRRDRLFQDFDLFGEPAWDILLDLFVMEASNRQVSVSSSCIASASPQTTALRYLKKLEDSGLIKGITDPYDRRRRWLKLQPSAMDLIREALA